MRITSVVAGVVICSLLFGAGCSSTQKKQISITADSIAYDKDVGTVTAQGNVKIETGDGSVVEAEKAVITPVKK